MLVALAGCDDPLKSVDRIEEPRPLAARVEVAGDPTRVNPAPGETVRVTWLVATPAGDAFSGFALAACAAKPHNDGLASCSAEPFALSAAPADTQRPTFEFVVPEDLDPSQASQVLVLGWLCPGASGNVDAGDARCDDGGGLRVSLDFALAGQGDNTNPDFLAGAISFDGEIWSERPLPTTSCAGLGFPEVSATGGDHVISVQLPASARDELVQEEPIDPARETLEIAHFLSAGELDHTFTRILPDTLEIASSVVFTPNSEAASEGSLVQFWFVVRDGRGGSDFTERAACVLP
jgi:hypothetical protein